MKRWLTRSLALCAFLAASTFVASCGGGGGGGSQGSPEANLSTRRASGIAFNYAQPGQGSGTSAFQTYRTPEPGTLSMLVYGIAGAGLYFAIRRRRRQ